MEAAEMCTTDAETVSQASYRICTAVNLGMETTLTTLEVAYGRGYAGITLLGNTGEVFRDGRERAKAAVESIGVRIPGRSIAVSFAPADIRKDGNQLDLPLALALTMLVTDRPSMRDYSNWLFVAELGLLGELRPIRGAIPFALLALSRGMDGIVVARENAADIATVLALTPVAGKPLALRAFATLAEVWRWLNSETSPSPPSFLPATPTAECGTLPDFDDMVLDPVLERAALTACTGMHNMLLRGTPGSGKSMLSARLPSLLPTMNAPEQIEAMKIYSQHAERVPPQLLAGRPPFRSPHHQTSAAAVLGTPETPGEIALAHGGVLFLDEIPEYRRDILESLREPLENGEIRVSRARKKVTWHARLMLVAAANNCPCGWFGSTKRVCRCATPKLLAYWQRLSGPILDRIDMHINVPDIGVRGGRLLTQLTAKGLAGQTARMRARVLAARAFAAARNEPLGVRFNRDLQGGMLVAASGLSAAHFEKLLVSVVGTSASYRSVIRCVRVARSLADVDQSPTMTAAHFAEAWAWQAEPAAKARGETGVLE